MLTIAYTPHWFYGKDIIIDGVSMLVLGLIAFFSFRYFHLDRSRKNYLWLGISFGMLALAFAFKMLTNFTLYYQVSKVVELGFATVTVRSTQGSNLPFFIGYLLYRGLSLLGLFLLYWMYEKKRSVLTAILVAYLLLVLTYFSDNAFQVFHFTSFVLLALICWELWKGINKRKTVNGTLLLWSFGIIALSQLLFIFLLYNEMAYVGGEIVQLVGYLLLLVTFVRVLRHAKEA